MVWNDWAHPEIGLDQALIVLAPGDEATLKANLSITAPKYRLGLYFTDAASLSASTFSDCGYGVRDQNDSSSVGSLRRASYLKDVPAASWADHLDYDCYSNSGCPYPGDSGSGVIWDAYLRNRYGSLVYRTLLAGTTTASLGYAVPSERVAEMVQWWQAGLCMTRFDTPTTFVNILPTATLSSGAQRITYDTTNHTISIGGYCLQATDSGMGGTVSSVPCDPSNPLQAWVQSGNLQMVEQRWSMCLTADASNALTTAPCSATAENAWVFSPSCEGPM